MSTRSFDTMINPQIEELLDRVDSKFSLVTLAARRARHMVPPQVSSVARKPLSIAFEEIAADKIERAPHADRVEDAADPADATA